jgi:hypothetical protein
LSVEFADSNGRGGGRDFLKRFNADPEPGCTHEEVRFGFECRYCHSTLIVRPTACKAKALDVSMRSRATFIRRRFQVDARRQRVVLMERMIADFDCMAADLDREILIEQERARIHDPAHFAYPTYAKAAILRRDNLKRSADELRAQLAKAKEAILGVDVAA